MIYIILPSQESCIVKVGRKGFRGKGSGNFPFLYGDIILCGEAPALFILFKNRKILEKCQKNSIFSREHKKKFSKLEF